MNSDEFNRRANESAKYVKKFGVESANSSDIILGCHSVIVSMAACYNDLLKAGDGMNSLTDEQVIFSAMTAAAAGVILNEIERRVDNGIL